MAQMTDGAGLFDDTAMSVPTAKPAHNVGLMKKAMKPYKPYPKQHLSYAIKQWSALREDLKAKHPGIDDASLAAMLTPDARHLHELRLLQELHPGVPDKPFVENLRIKWTREIELGMGSTDENVLAKLFVKKKVPKGEDQSSKKVTARDTSGMSDSDPNTYKKTEFLDYNQDVEDIHKRWDQLVTEESMPTCRKMVQQLVDKDPTTPKEFEKIMHLMRREYKMTAKKSELLHVYNTMVATEEIERNAVLRKLLQKKTSKSESGVLVITVLTSPYPQYTGKVIQIQS